MRALLIVLLFVAGTASAEEWKCPPSESASSCFAGSAIGRLKVCGYLVSLQLQLQRANGKTVDFKCIEDGLREAEPAYARAVKASRIPAQTERIKDFYAAWRAGFSGIRPATDEVVIAYNNRQAATEASLTQKAERIKLD